MIGKCTIPTIPHTIFSDRFDTSYALYLPKSFSTKLIRPYCCYCYSLFVYPEAYGGHFFSHLGCQFFGKACDYISKNLTTHVASQKPLIKELLL